MGRDLPSLRANSSFPNTQGGGWSMGVKWRETSQTEKEKPGERGWDSSNWLLRVGSGRSPVVYCIFKLKHSLLEGGLWESARFSNLWGSRRSESYKIHKAHCQVIKAVTGLGERRVLGNSWDEAVLSAVAFLWPNCLWVIHSLLSDPWPCSHR